jgi:hypothetical protein
MSASDDSEAAAEKSVDLNSENEDGEDDQSVGFICPACHVETHIHESSVDVVCSCGYTFVQSKNGYIKDGFVVDRCEMESVSSESDSEEYVSSSDDNEEDEEEEEEEESESDADSDCSWEPPSKVAKII